MSWGCTSTLSTRWGAQRSGGDGCWVSKRPATRGIGVKRVGALMRISGAPRVALLSKVCAIDFAEEVTPNGAPFRSSVAKLVTDVVRDDRGGAVVPAALRAVLGAVPLRRVDGRRRRVWH